MTPARASPPPCFSMEKEKSPMPHQHRGISRSRKPILLGGGFNAEQFNFEDKRRVRRNGSDTPFAIAKRGRNDEHAFASYFHADKALVPSANDITRAKRKDKG